MPKSVAEDTGIDISKLSHDTVPAKIGVDTS